MTIMQTTPRYSIMPPTGNKNQQGTMIYLGIGLEFANVTGRDHAENAARIVAICNAYNAGSFERLEVLGESDGQDHRQAT